MAKVIGVLQQKGGVGKTTIATNLAVALTMRKLKVCLVDSDKQRSARDWHESGGGNLVTCIGLDSDTLANDINRISSGYDVIIIDGPPKVSKLSAAAVRVSSAILIPVQPGPYDVLATADIVELIKERQEIAKETAPKAAFIINRVIKNTLLSREIHDALKDYGFPVLDAKLSQGVIYPTSASKGESIFCHGENQAVHEFNTLVEEVIARFL